MSRTDAGKNSTLELSAKHRGQPGLVEALLGALASEEDGLVHCASFCRTSRWTCMSLAFALRPSAPICEIRGCLRTYCGFLRLSPALDFSGFPGFRLPHLGIRQSGLTRIREEREGTQAMLLIREIDAILGPQIAVNPWTGGGPGCRHRVPGSPRRL